MPLPQLCLHQLPLVLQAQLCPDSPFCTAIIYLLSFALKRIIEHLLYAVTFTVMHAFHLSSNPQRKLGDLESQQKPPPPPRKIAADVLTKEMSS